MFEEDPDDKVFVRKEMPGARKTYYDPLYEDRVKFLEMLCKYGCVRRYHEYILPNRPCKLFADVDVKGVSMEEGMRILYQLMDDIASYFEEWFEESLEKPLIFSASSFPEKLSIHIIYENTWFETPRAVGRFMESFKDRVDMNVYCKYGLSSLRMVYNWKVGHEHRILYPEFTSSTEVDVDIIRRSCVSVSVFPLPPDCVILRYGEDTSFFSVPSEDNDAIAANVLGVSRVYSKIRVIYGDLQIIYTEISDGGFCLTFRQPVHCYARAVKNSGDGYHHSNTMTLRSEDYVHMYWFCMGCRKRLYLHWTCQHMFIEQGQLDDDQ